MRTSVRLLLLLLLIAAAICISEPYPALARNPVPVKECQINPSCADPGEDPHLSILVEPAPGSNGKSGSSGEELLRPGETVVIRKIPLNKFELFIFSVYTSIDKILF
jgi:hypothetical protein